MINFNDITFLKGSLRYKGAPEVGLEITFPLSNKQKELDNFFISTTVDLSDVYDRERNNSNLYFLSSKFSFIFENSYYGVAMPPDNVYPPFNNNLFYLNEESTKENQLSTPNTIIQWPGYPQYNEFCFIRTDYDVSGYTLPPNEHLFFEAKSATSYNWSFYLSYVYDIDTEFQLGYNFFGIYDGIEVELPWEWDAEDGIPFIMTKVNDFNGRTLWKFECPFKHNLKVGENVLLKNFPFYTTTTNAISKDLLLEVYSLGDGTKDSEKKIFNILDLNFIEGFGSFYNYTTNNFYRVTDPQNVDESQSKYYIRKHKILTNAGEAIITNSGFEQNAFRTTSKFFTADLTPNQVTRIAIKENSQTYNISFNKTIDLTDLRDNQGRPISEIFITIENRGYFGYFHPSVDNKSIQQGWEFNLENKQINSDATWWDRTSDKTFIDLEVDSYTKTFNEDTLEFKYMKTYNIGDELLGDLCEWNEITQEETVLSHVYHRMIFNDTTFFTFNSMETFPNGYFYKPFYKIPLKVYSDYVEEGDPATIEDVPDYAFLSKKYNKFLWRDLYTVGFFDANGNGIDYPFMNGRHYPYNDFIFRLIPQGTNVFNYYDIQTPTIDGCE